MSNTNRLPLDLSDWLESLALHQRLTLLNRNITAGMADGVIVAEIVDCIYPKIVQLHNYSDQSSVSGRLANWRTLNKKVLKVIRCEVSEEQMAAFANRQSAPAVIDFLRYLRSKLTAFEPLYISGQYTSDLTAQLHAKPSVVPSTSGNVNDKDREKSSPAKTTKGTTKATTVASPPILNSTSKSHTDMSTKTSTTSSTTASVSARRPSMKVNNELLREREERKDISRRASLLTKSEMDEMYSRFTNQLRTESIHLARRNDDLSQISESMDAKFIALRQQNKEELLKTEKRLTQVKSELQALETGKSLSLIDDEVHYYLHDPSRVEEVSQQLRRASLAVSTIKPEDYDYGDGLSLHNDDSYDSDNNGDDYDEEDEGEEDDDEDDDIPPPPPPPSKLQNLFQGTQQKSPESHIETSAKGDIQLNSSKSKVINDLLNDKQTDSNATTSKYNPKEFTTEEDELPPPPPTTRVVNYIRGYSEEHSRHFYTAVTYVDGAMKSEKSQWTVPTEGIVQCKDENTGNIYYTDTSTGKSVWRLSDFDK